MKLEVKGATNITVDGGKIISRTGIEVKRDGDAIIVTGKSGINIGGGSIQINGNNISGSNINICGMNVGNVTQVNSSSGRKSGFWNGVKNLFKGGSEDTVIINGEEYVKKESGKEDKKIKTYRLDAPLHKIDVVGSGTVFVNDSNDLSENLALSVKGSGDVSIRTPKVCKNLNASVVGSGDIDLHNLKIESANLSVTGSGDITARGCSVKHLNKTVVGSGDINGI